nr:protein C19orf12 homolog [Leptinotarsa decemlineata]
MIQNIPSSELIQICEVLAEQENLQVTLREATKGAMIAGFGAFAGGLLAGPFGLAVGGTLGSITAAWRSREKYRSVVDILRNELTSQQQEKLATSIKNILQNVKPDDCIKLLALVLTSTSLKEAVLKEIGNFLMKEMSLQMIR